MVLWVKLCSCVAIPVAGLGHQRGDLVGAQHPPGRHLPVADQHRALVQPGGGAVVERGEHLGPTSSTITTPALASRSGPRLG